MRYTNHQGQHGRQSYETVQISRVHICISLKLRQYPVIHINYCLSNCTISNWKDLNRSSDLKSQFKSRWWHETAIDLVYMWDVLDSRVGSVLGANTMVQWAAFESNNNRSNPGKDGSGRLRSFQYFPLKRTLWKSHALVRLRLRSLANRSFVLFHVIIRLICLLPIVLQMSWSNGYIYNSSKGFLHFNLPSWPYWSLHYAHNLVQPLLNWSCCQ